MKWIYIMSELMPPMMQVSAHIHYAWYVLCIKWILHKLLDIQEHLMNNRSSSKNTILSLKVPFAERYNRTKPNVHSPIIFVQSVENKWNNAAVNNSRNSNNNNNNNIDGNKIKEKRYILTVDFGLTPLEFLLYCDMRIYKRAKVVILTNSLITL